MMTIVMRMMMVKRNGNNNDNNSISILILSKRIYEFHIFESTSFRNSTSCDFNCDYLLSSWGIHDKIQPLELWA